MSALEPPSLLPVTYALRSSRKPTIGSEMQLDGQSGGRQTSRRYFIHEGDDRKDDSRSDGESISLRYRILRMPAHVENVGDDDVTALDGSMNKRKGEGG